MSELTRSEIIDKIRSAKAELHTAGPIHRRDLQKHIKRLKGKLIQYDRAKDGSI